MENTIKKWANSWENPLDFAMLKNTKVIYIFSFILVIRKHYIEDWKPNIEKYGKTAQITLWET